MPIYEYECDNCSKKIDEFKAADKASEPVICPSCSNKMRRIYSFEFILKGDNWPGKEIQRQRFNERDKNEESMHNDDIAQKEADMVLKERRKGRKNMEEFKKHNPQIIKRYKESLKKGIKGK